MKEQDIAIPMSPMGTGSKYERLDGGKRERGVIVPESTRDEIRTTESWHLPPNGGIMISYGEEPQTYRPTEVWSRSPDMIA